MSGGKHLSNKDMEFDLEDILQEFGMEPELPPEPEPEEEPPVPQATPGRYEGETLGEYSEEYASDEDYTDEDYIDDSPAAPDEEDDVVPPEPEEEPAEDYEEDYEEAYEEPAPPPRKGKKRGKDRGSSRSEEEKIRSKFDDPLTFQDEDWERAEEKARAIREAMPRKESFGRRLGMSVLSLIFAAVSLVCLAWSLQNLHPETMSVEAARAAGTTNLVTKLNGSVNNAKADALSNVVFIPKHYSIPEEDLVAPAPNPACFGTVSIDNAAAVLDVIQKARDSGLLDGQDVIFDPNANFYYDSDIEYYCDDTILTICWKEVIDGFTCSCCEVKIADASQFRRKITDDTFGSPVRLYATALAKATNAVVAMNADFYMFRDFGIMAYQRQLYRMDTSVYTGMYRKYNCIDTAFIDENGDFKFFHRLEESNWDDMQRFIDDNHLLFSISFGPVLIEDGVLQTCDWYPAGEINTGYSRAGIGQLDKLHYFYMSLNHSPEAAARWTVNQFGQHMFERGLHTAYCLDGGQTSEIVFQGKPYNYIDFGAEREVSDIIYFASAIPESEVSP